MVYVLVHWCTIWNLPSYTLAESSFGLHNAMKNDALHKLSQIFKDRYMVCYSEAMDLNRGRSRRPPRREEVADIWYRYLRKLGVKRVSSHNRLVKRVVGGVYIPDPHILKFMWGRALKNGFLLTEDLADRILLLGLP